jgi:V8-like Glu-specific endopeptidase
MKETLKGILRSVIVGVLASVIVVCGFSLYQSLISNQIEGGQIKPYTLYPSKGSRGHLVRIGNREYSFFCSGVVISKDFILTAAHCVTHDYIGLIKNEQLVISDEWGGVVTPNAKTVSVELNRDIALIKGDFSEFESVAVDWYGEQQLNLRNTTVFACGFPSGELGYCSELYYEGNSFFQMKFSNGQLYKGQSGGPVFILNEMDKPVLIGINSAVEESFIIVAPVVGARSLLWGM